MKRKDLSISMKAMLCGCEEDELVIEPGTLRNIFKSTTSPDTCECKYCVRMRLLRKEGKKYSPLPK